MDGHLSMDNAKLPFVCAACNKSFAVKSHLNDHLYSHIKGKFLISEICCKGFSEISELNEYFRNYVVKYACDTCNAAFVVKSDVNEHHSVHLDKNLYVCKPCNKTFKDKISLYVHIVAGDKKLQSPTWEEAFVCQFCKEAFVCQFCKERFTCKTYLTTLHIPICCKENPYYVCIACNKVFNNKESLCVHNREDHTNLFICELCGKLVTHKGSFIRRHLQFHEDFPILKTYTCTVCNEQFSHPIALNNHYQIHKETNIFACKICSEQFSDQIALNNHYQIHKETNIFACEICSEQFSDQIALNNHCQIHKKTKIFVCEICSKQFQRRSLLEMHLDSHKKPYSCEHCDKKFGCKRSLKLHLVVHNRDKISRLLNLPEGVFEKIFKC